MHKKIYLLLVLLSCYGLAAAQKAKTWEVGLDYSNILNGHSTWKGLTDSRTSNVTTIGNVKYTTANNSKPKLSLVGYRLNVGYYLLEDLKIGYAYVGNSKAMNVKFTTETVALSVTGINTSYKFPNTISVFKVKHRRTTHNFFARKMFAQGFFAQGGLAVIDWSEEVKGQYKIKWPSVALSFNGGRQWSFGDIKLNAGLEVYFSGKPKVTTDSNFAVNNQHSVLSAALPSTIPGTVIAINGNRTVMPALQAGVATFNAPAKDHLKSSVNKKGGLLYGFYLGVGYNFN